MRRPASGLVTAVEALMRACSGTWIAHGACNADRETVDKHDRVPVPPGDPGYTLHFVLPPRMVKERLPKATIVTFWHIPWPNSESFGLCPWRTQILEGLLGSTILGFH